jgi:hypothetical protein
MAKKNVTPRRERTLERFNTQLLSGVKPEKVNGKTTNNLVSLTPEDVLRINKQVGILTERIKLVKS